MNTKYPSSSDFIASLKEKNPHALSILEDKYRYLGSGEKEKKKKKKLQPEISKLKFEEWIDANISPIYSYKEKKEKENKIYAITMN